MNGRTLVLFGANGRLGQAVAAIAAQRGLNVQTMSWTDAGTAADVDGRAVFARLAAIKGDIDLVFAGGVSNPGAAEATLMLANVDRPVSVIESTREDPRYRYLTIGSVMETFADLAASNRYLGSKAALWRRVETLANDPRRRGQFVHLRGHTFYGGRPASHSFLGQLYTSLRTRQPFPMSAGDQLREYMHVEDVARSIVALLARDWRKFLTFDLSTGEPITLRDLATAVFSAFQCNELLRLGALPTPPGENKGQRFPRSPDWLLGRPRAPVEGIIKWLSALLERS
jgi:nucleoside-diphosphate-sugar epimerase